MNAARLEDIRKEIRLKGLINSWTAQELIDYIDHLGSQLVQTEAQIRVLIKERDFLKSEIGDLF